MAKPKRKKQKDKVQKKEPKVLDKKTLELNRILWGTPAPTLEELKPPRTRKETFRLLKAGKLKIKWKPTTQVVVDYESEATADAEKREKFKYIKDHIKKTGPVKKKKIKREYVFIKGRNKKGDLEFWKARLKRMSIKKEKPYETPFIYESVLGNDRYRIANAVETITKIHGLRNQLNERSPGIYDRMEDEFLSMFDEDVRNEDGKKRRNVCLEFIDVNPDKVCEMIEPLRTPILSRLKKFEEERTERLRAKPMPEKEKQRYVRKLKADEAKVRYLQILRKYLKDHYNEGSKEIMEKEAMKYQYELKEFERSCNVACEEIMAEMDCYCQVTLEKEIEDALNLRRLVVEESIMTTATHKEIELQYGYRRLFLPAKLSEQKESYQLDMSSYIQYWAKKTHEVEKEVQVQKQYLKKHLETSKILQAIEHVPTIKKIFADKTKKVAEESKLKIKAALIPLKEKIEILENIRKENRQLEASINQYVHVVPEFINKLKEFIRITQVESSEREQFLLALDDIETFRSHLLKQHEEFMKITESGSSTESKEDMSKTRSDIAIVKQPEEKEKVMAFDLANRILSDGELEQSAKDLLKVKFIISDLLTRVIPIPKLKYTELHRDIKDFNTVENVIRSEGETYITKSRKRFDSFSIIDKLKQVSEKLDIAFQIVGDKYSIPDLVTVGEYLNKRTASVYKIIEKHRDKLENK